ncbi:serine/threonine kinase [Amniculicola lignicola CBS 123094]|uniref:mitogen-activated protein kinase n=1 Tax=Amniculicola lignicola CBS 123094 TaxID=1392246 RepID=A0A6A5WEV2_9PLEO|nr:serine/threonine kinase [Amniculicola lignicola CBS 123094]
MESTSGQFIAVKEIIFDETDKNKAARVGKSRLTAGLARHVVQIAQSLDHPRILPYLGHLMKDNKFSILTEFFPGGTLGACLRKYGKFGELQASNFTRQILEGLAYMHSEGVIHRDLKADKIYLDLNGTCKIGWNLMMERVDHPYGEGVPETRLWSTYWQGPEVIRSEGLNYTPKSDIWSLGCLLLELVSGQRPFSEEEVIGTIYRLGTLSVSPPIPDDIIGELRAETFAFLYDCWTIDVKERPTAENLLLSPFCYIDKSHDFLDSDLYGKIRAGFLPDQIGK